MKSKLAGLFPTWFRALPHSDKLIHAVLGTIIFLASWILFFACVKAGLLVFGMIWTVYMAVIVVTIVAILVELWDLLTNKGTPEFMDFVATVVPSYLIALISIIIF